MKAGYGPRGVLEKQINRPRQRQVAGVEKHQITYTYLYVHASTYKYKQHTHVMAIIQCDATVRCDTRETSNGPELDPKSSSATRSEPYCDAISALASGLDGGYPIPCRVEGNTTKTTLATAPTTTGSAMSTFFCWSLSDG